MRLCVLYCIACHCIALYHIVLYCIVLYCIVLYCIALYCIVLYCIVLYCIVLYRMVSYCIIWYRIVSERQPWPEALWPWVRAGAGAGLCGSLGRQQLQAGQRQRHGGGRGLRRLLLCPTRRRCLRINLRHCAVLPAPLAPVATVICGGGGGGGGGLSARSLAVCQSMWSTYIYIYIYI